MGRRTREEEGEMKRLIALCYHCRMNYIDAGYRVFRTEYEQTEKKTCDICGGYSAFDYWVKG